MVVRKIIAVVATVYSLQVLGMADSSYCIQRVALACAKERTRSDAIAERDHQQLRANKSASARDSVTENLSIKLEQQFPYLPSQLTAKIQQAMQVIQIANHGQSYMANSQLQQCKDTLSECKTAVTSYFAEQTAKSTSQSSCIRARTRTDLTPLKNLISIVTTVAAGIEGHVALNTVLQQVSVDIISDTLKNKSSLDIGLNACSFFLKQQQNNEQTRSLQTKLEAIKSAIKLALTMAKICSGGGTPDDVIALIYNAAEFMNQLQNACNNSQSGNKQQINSFINDAQHNAQEFINAEQALSKLSSEIDLSTKIIDTCYQKYVQDIQTASTKLECMNIQELQQLRDIVYPVGMVARTLYDQFIKKSQQQQIDPSKREESKSLPKDCHC